MRWWPRRKNTEPGVESRKTQKASLCWFPIRSALHSAAGNRTNEPGRGCCSDTHTHTQGNHSVFSVGGPLSTRQYGCDSTRNTIKSHNREKSGLILTRVLNSSTRCLDTGPNTALQLTCFVLQAPPKNGPIEAPIIDRVKPNLKLSLKLTC